MRYVAFLKAINVGGHVVKMDRLREVFTGLGLANVETFIASGNVVFDSRARGTAALEAKVARTLEGALGYAVPTFIRTDAEVATIAAYAPFPAAEMAAARVVHVGFLAEPLGSAARATMRRLTSDAEAFHTSAREFYWLCRVPFAESPFAKVSFEKAFGADVTFRSLTTIRKLSAKYPPGR